jgi:hypothetical protein
MSRPKPGHGHDLNAKIKPKVSEDFEYFTTQGEVSQIGDTDESKVQVTIVRDTCCAQSLIKEGVLPLPPRSDTHALIRGVGMNFIEVPLYEINLESELVSGPVIVGGKA